MIRCWLGLLCYLFVMIIRGFLSITTHLPQQILHSLRFYCSQQAKSDILASNYHLQGPKNFRRSRAVEILLAAKLHTIESLQQRLNPLRELVISQPSAPLDQYVGLYQQLKEAVSGCQINNEWVYSVISWYNMTPFYRVLFVRLLRSGHEELDYLVKALHSMPKPTQIPNQLVNNPHIETFYRRLNPNIHLDLLRKLEEVIPFQFNRFSKRKYYQRYLRDHLEGTLKTINPKDTAQVSNLVWLFQTAVKAMCDDEVLCTKLEKAVLTMRLSFTIEDLDRLMAAYQMKGRVSPAIYEDYLKPHLKKKMLDSNQAVKCLKFLVCSEANDQEMLKILYKRLDEIESISDLTHQNSKTLHFYTHYLRIKGTRLTLRKQLEQELHQHCKKNAQSHTNLIAQLILKERKANPNPNPNPNPKAKPNPYNNKKLPTLANCTPTTKAKLNELTPQKREQFHSSFKNQLGSLDVKTAIVYKQARFCCIDLEYCIHSRGEMLNLESDCQSYAFSSGRLVREMEVRDELLGYYGIKVRHKNLMNFKVRAKATEEELLNSRRVTLNRY